MTKRGVRSGILTRLIQGGHSFLWTGRAARQFLPSHWLRSMQPIGAQWNSVSAPALLPVGCVIMTCMAKRAYPGWNTRRSWLILGGLLWVLSTATHWGAELGVVGEPTLPPPGVGSSVVRLLGAFALVLSIALGGVWLLRNGSRFAVRSGIDRTLKVLEVRMLGGRQSLVVVGYEDQRMLLATSPTGVSFLCRLPAAEPGGSAVGEPNLAPTFMDALNTAVGRPG